MRNISLPSAASLGAAMDEQIAQLPQTQLPSLRVVQSTSAKAVEIDYKSLREPQLEVTSPDGEEVHSDQVDFAMSWIQMVQSTLAPGGVTLLRALVMPSPEPIRGQRATHLAVTALAVSTWPFYRAWPEGLSLGAYLTLSLEHADGDLKLCPTVRLGGSGLETGELKAFMADLDDVQSKIMQYWSRCAFEIGPWLADGGVTEIELVVPVTPPQGSPPYVPPRSATVLH